MAEWFNYKRVQFKKSKQEDFIRKAEKKISIAKMAQICGLSERTIRDWRREKFLMDFNALQKICKAVKIPLPQNIKLKDRYWYGLKGASAGGRAMWQKYGRIGNDIIRGKRWKEWWEKEGKFKKHKLFNTPKLVKEPKFSNNLAEFVGIILGDGGISKYQITVTLCSKDERKYSNFIYYLIKRLFGVPVKIKLRRESSTINLIVSRINLVNFCIEKLGMKIGNKITHQVDIPVWIKRNKSYSIACVRGLMDTDGSVFKHSYKVGGKLYSYKKFSFTSRSHPLRQSVYKILNEAGINARLARIYDVRIDSQNDMKKYFKIFGSHNPKHLIRYKK